MRYPKDHIQKTHQAILDAAGRVFRRLGFHGGGVDAVMAEAGLTAGGFYAHFKNKDALFSEFIRDDMEQMRKRWYADPSPSTGHERLLESVRRYLSRVHFENVEKGCFLPTLISEISRAGEDSKLAFEDGLNDWMQTLASELDESYETQVLALLALSVGGLSLSRSVNNQQFADRIREACMNAADELGRSCKRKEHT